MNNRVIWIVVLCLLLSACGVRFYYSQLDWLVPWYISDYMTLDEAQKNLLSERLAEQLEWHCRTQLPDYAGWLREVHATFAGDEPSPVALRRHTEQLELFWHELGRSLAPDAARILAAADDAQIAELFGQLHARNREIRAEYIEPDTETLHDERIARMQKRLQRWFGPLNERQQVKLAEWSRDLMPISEAWLVNRQSWQVELWNLLKRRDDVRQLEAGLTQLLVRPQAYWNDAYRERVDHNRQRTLLLLIELHETASSDQRQRLLGRLDSLAADFEKLACTQETPAMAR